MKNEDVVENLIAENTGIMTFYVSKVKLLALTITY